MTRNPAPATRSAALHSPDYPRCLDGTYGHLWQIDDKGVGRCDFCQQSHTFRENFETRWASLQKSLKQELEHA